MRILQIAPRYAPAWAFGGGVRMTFELASEWVRQGHEVTVFTSDQRDNQHRFVALKDNLEGIKIHRFRNPVHWLASHYSFLFYYPIGMARALQSIMGQFDVVHIAEARGPLNRWVAKRVPKQGIPFVWSAYGGLADGQGLRKIYRAFHDRIFNTRGIVQRSGGLIAQTNHEVDIYRKFGAMPERIRLIPLAVNWRDFEQLPVRGQFRERMSIKETEKLVLFLGRIHRTKGLQILISAFPDVVKKIPTARLAIVGWNHGFLNKARQLVADLRLDTNVVFTGPLYGKDRFTAYVDSEIFAITPSVYEETSLAALEACACGVSCVLTRQSEIPGLDLAGAGVTVNCTPAEVAQALIEGLQGNTSAVRGANARRLIQDRFTSKTVAMEHARFFGEICHT